jgi:hypothetical protein
LPKRILSSLDELSRVGETLLGDALAFIDRHFARNLAEGKTTPFFIYYAVTEAHWPCVPPDELRGRPIRGRTGIDNRTDMV